MINRKSRLAGLASLPKARSFARLELPAATPSNNAARGGLKVITFLVSQTWIAPAIKKLALASGRGAAGNPSSGAHDYVDGYRAFAAGVIYIKAESRYVSGNPVYNATSTGSVPAGFRQYDSEDANNIYYTDWSFSYFLVDQGNYVGPTTGASATGFGQTFVGGTGGVAALTEFADVTITPGASYPLVIPAGGSITISY